VQVYTEFLIHNLKGLEMGDKLRRLFRNMDMSMVIIVIILLANNFLNNSMSFGEWMYSKAVILPAIFIGLTFHEAAHGFASHWLGDPTPGMQGRLTLNPLKHMDPVGFICLMFAGFGWGVPVQIDPRYYKHRRSGEMIVGLAGVTTNFAIALIFSFVAKYMAENMSWEFYEGIGGILLDIVIYMVGINIVLMIFNLLPVPPLDGFGVLTQIFKLDRYDWYWPLYSKGSFILMIMIIFDITDKIIDPLYGFFLELLLW